MIKNIKEIEKMRIAGNLASEVLLMIEDHVKQFWWSLKIAAKISGQRCQIQQPTWLHGHRKLGSSHI